MTVSAILLSLSLVLKTFTSVYIPLFGQNGMSVGLSGVFSMLPALLFGPVYGAVVSGLSDVLGHFIRPQGAYLPWLTAAAALGGFVRGWLWQALKGMDGKKLRMPMLVAALVLMAVGAYNIAVLQSDKVVPGYYTALAGEAPDLDGLHRVSRLIVSRTMNMKNPEKGLLLYRTFFTSAVLFSGVLVLALMLSDIVIERMLGKQKRFVHVPRLLWALTLSGLLVTTVNTYTLRETAFQAWKVLPFMVVYIPRAIEEVLSNTVKAYAVAVLLSVCYRQKDISKVIFTK